MVDLYKKDKLMSVLTVSGVEFDAKNFASLATSSEHKNQNDTNDAFSEKWAQYDKEESQKKYFEMQKKWYLELYGFESESALSKYLKQKEYIYDAGCGLGFKAEWFASLAPDSIVIGVDFSETAELASKKYATRDNLFFLRGDIADKIFHENSIDYISCDQVIMHTEMPEKTFERLSSTTKHDGEFSCYFYAKKALPRELIDDYFRSHCSNMSHDEIAEMSAQLTELGKRLSALNVTLNAPDIPALGIKGGEIDIQRFIYWNFLKCFWNEDMGEETSTMTNFDWYSPSNAKRFSEEEVVGLVRDNNLSVIHFHKEEACYSVRLKKA